MEFRRVLFRSADAFLLLRILVGTDQEKAPVGVLRQRRPGLLTVDDILVAVANRDGAERSKVGARSGLGIALAQPILARQDARQKEIGRESSRERVCQ